MSNERDPNYYDPTPEDLAWADDIMTRPGDARQELAHIARKRRLSRGRENALRVMDRDAACALMVDSLRAMASWIETTKPYAMDLDYGRPNDGTMRWITVGASHPWGG